MTGLAIDSTHRVPPAVLKAVGVIAVGRYLDFPGHRDDWKAIDAAEANELLDNGIGLEMLCETIVDASTKGRSEGTQHGQVFRAAAKALGPRFVNGTLVWTVDENVKGYADVADYDAGFVAAGGPGAPYAQRNVIDGSFAAVRSVGGHQSNARAWSGYTVSPHAHILQGLPSSAQGLGDHDPDQLLVARTPLVVWPAAPAPAPAPWAPPPYPGHPLRLGATEHEVAILKLLLKVDGFGAGLNLDGEAINHFGAGTEAAVKRLQAASERNAHLPVKPDGIVGPKTWGWACDVATVQHVVAGRR